MTSLRQDCELLVTFDSDHTDSGNGIVKDFSGKQRHLTASGGPTYALSSPVGEAAGFDGTDDFFETGYSPPTVDEVSFFVIANADEQDPSNNQVNTGSARGKSGPWSFATRVDKGSLVVSNGNTFTEIKTPNNASGFARGYGEAVANDQLKIRIENSVNTSDLSHDLSAPASTLTIGARSDFKGGGNQFYGGQIAFVGVWFRTLSESEIDRLFDMTDRMVSQL